MSTPTQNTTMGVAQFVCALFFAIATCRLRRRPDGTERQGSVGQTDGEGVEFGWDRVHRDAYRAEVEWANSREWPRMREMGPGKRQETIDDGSRMWRKEKGE
ncbi:hypothetical protein B0H11DRAFT_2214449 [Mycena galericulata]|nr:hypothetical protein B0H11DRAFT_2253206 [Mycena galericulata]KAJ7447052.1 hypothetical protein B0H11DRAFT_2248480 [Mycena galericulata]KAJ7511564.1 hypothetical protein B0H11DRAFT_2214449 [Mycena galericulata]